MKILLAWLGIGLLFSQTQEEPFIKPDTLGNLIYDLARAHAAPMVGWEYVSRASDKIPDASSAFHASHWDIPAVCKIITKNTDYECMVGADYLLILPKQKLLKHAAPISKQSFTVPRSLHLHGSLHDIFEKLQPDESDFKPQSLHLFYVTFTMSQISEGTISVKARTYLWYELLNDMATQVKANRWILSSDMIMTNGKISQQEGSKNLNFGHVAFFSN